MNIVRLDENDKFYDYFNIDIIDDVEVITKDGERFTGEIETYGPGNELSIRGTIIDGLREGKWAYYFENGGFPYATQINDDDIRKDYLMGIYNTVLLKDIVARLKISDVMRLESVVKYIFDNIGNLTSLSKIANTLTSMGRKTDAKTIEKYIRGLTDSLLVHEVSRYNIKGKEFLSTLSKYYVADLGLRQMILGNRNIDMGHILENVIYLELLRRKGNVYVGQFDKNEIDFVVINSNEIEYYQVALTVLDENTLKRELDAFKNIKDNYPKYLITLDDVMVNTDYDGIKVVNALEWLLGE